MLQENHAMHQKKRMESERQDSVLSNEESSLFLSFSSLFLGISMKGALSFLSCLFIHSTFHMKTHWQLQRDLAAKRLLNICWSSILENTSEEQPTDDQQTYRLEIPIVPWGLSFGNLLHHCYNNLWTCWQILVWQIWREKDVNRRSRECNPVESSIGTVLSPFHWSILQRSLIRGLIQISSGSYFCWMISESLLDEIM